jgi:hypothetical protein
MPDLTRFDRDPEALEWARGKIQATTDRYVAFAERATAEGKPGLAAEWQKTADAVQRDLIGGHGEIAEFDERLPAILAHPPAEPGCAP